MSKTTFDKVKTLSKIFFRYCCFGSASGVYGFSDAYSRTATTQMNLIEPYFDDVTLPICDNFDVEMFVFYMFHVLFSSFVCQISSLIQFAIDTFSGEKRKCNHIET